jgi:hypothetical protein
MTTKPKAADEAPVKETAEPAVEQPKASEAPPCGKPHHLPMLAGHVACQLDALDPDREPGSPEHEHRHEDGDTLYVW